LSTAVSGIPDYIFHRKKWTAYFFSDWKCNYKRRNSVNWRGIK